jgi:hypothetical protein
MGDGVEIRGVTASIKWAYHVAATLQGFSIRHDKRAGRWTAGGRIAVSNSYFLAQRPLELEVPHAGGAWRWRVRAITVDGQAIRATLEPLPAAADPPKGRVR